jgi:hypothetical protein
MVTRNGLVFCEWVSYKFGNRLVFISYLGKAAFGRTVSAPGLSNDWIVLLTPSSLGEMEVFWACKFLSLRWTVLLLVFLVKAFLMNEWEFVYWIPKLVESWFSLLIVSYLNLIGSVTFIGLFLAAMKLTPRLLPDLFLGSLSLLLANMSYELVYSSSVYSVLIYYTL